MAKKPSRAVTRSRACKGCFNPFKPPRRDSKYCSAACRQKAHRARGRGKFADFSREIEATRLRYWCLVYERARAAGIDVSEALRGCTQYVDIDGNVYEGFPGLCGRYLGKSTPHRPGWNGWGLEAAAPPFCPPPLINEEDVKKAKAARLARRKAGA